MGKMPKLSLVNHKQLYLVSNPLKLAPYKVVLLPYLHERKIQYSNTKSNNKYFCTFIEEKTKI